MEMYCVTQFAKWVLELESLLEGRLLCHSDVAES